MGLTTQTYDIITRIAVGNGAIVYRAVEKETLRQVALKLLTQEGDVDHRLDLDALFTDEAWLRSIDGTHVCRLLTAYSDDDGPVLAYEYAPGMNGAELPLQKPLDAAQSLDVAAQLISALRSGERQRCPHGDMKPSNIIFVDLPGGRPYVFVLDWGLAAYRQTTPDDSLLYLAPEMLAGDPPSHRADLFSAGAVLFYLYTGKVLVAGTDREQLMEAWRNVRPAMLAELRPDLSPKLVEWVCRLLALDPSQRPASAVEAGSTLAALGLPPPMVPPEIIRPRPVPKPAPAPVPAPPVHRPSSIVQPPFASGIRAPAALGGAAAVPAPRISPVVKKPSLLPTILIYSTLLIVVVGGLLWMLTRKPDTTAQEPALENAHTTPRPPAPSVSQPPAPTPTPSQPQPPTPAPVKVAVAPAPTKVAVAPAMPKDEGSLIAEESFNYQAGRGIDGQSGGSGWDGRWHGLVGKTEAASLSYLQHPATGGSLHIPQSQQELELTRSLGSLTHFIADPAKGGHWYMSLLIQHGTGTPASGGEIMFNPIDMADIHNFIRVVVEDKGGVLRVNLNAEPQAVEVPQDGKPLYLILRIDLKNPRLGNYDIKGTLWINPDLASAKPGKTGRKLEVELKNQMLPKQLGLLMRKKRSQSETRIDEVRFARRMVDVVFKPVAEEEEAGP